MASLSALPGTSIAIRQWTSVVTSGRVSLPTWKNFHTGALCLQNTLRLPALQSHVHVHCVHNRMVLGTGRSDSAVSKILNPVYWLDICCFVELTSQCRGGVWVSELQQRSVHCSLSSPPVSPGCSPCSVTVSCPCIASRRPHSNCLCGGLTSSHGPQLMTVPVVLSVHLPVCVLLTQVQPCVIVVQFSGWLRRWCLHDSLRVWDQLLPVWLVNVVLDIRQRPVEWTVSLWHMEQTHVVSIAECFSSWVSHQLCKLCLVSYLRMSAPLPLISGDGSTTLYLIWCCTSAYDGL